MSLQYDLNRVNINNVIFINIAVHCGIAIIAACPDNRSMEKVGHQGIIFFACGAAEYIIGYAIEFGRRGRPVANGEGNPVGIHAGLKFLPVIVAVYFKEVAFLVFFWRAFPFARADEDPGAGADKVVAFAAACEFATNDTGACFAVNALNLAHFAAEYFSNNGIDFSVFFHDT